MQIACRPVIRPGRGCRTICSISAPTGRSTQGVIVFDTAEEEHVVSVEHITDEADNGNGAG